MRKLLRAIARARMQNDGIQQINKKRNGASYFALHWRDYVGLPVAIEANKPRRKNPMRRLMAKLSQRRNRYAH